MSFAAETKNELAREYPKKKCCELAEIAGFIRVSGRLRLKGLGNVIIVIGTEHPAIARHFKKSIQDYFGINTNLEVSEGSRLTQKKQYEITIGPEDKSEQILREIGILQVKEGYNTLTDGIYDAVIKKRCCKKSYLKGMFMGAGRINDPKKGYHLEIVCNTKVLATDLKKMINSFVDLKAKVTERKGKYVVYMKNFSYITDTLAIIGAHNQLLEMQNRKVENEMKSQATRMVNCDSANIDRTAAAAEKQIQAIKKIDKQIGIDALPEQLTRLAKLRLENPDASLTQLGEMMNPPIGKSGLYKRMDKILKTAEHM